MRLLRFRQRCLYDTIQLPPPRCRASDMPLFHTIRVGFDIRHFFMFSPLHNMPPHTTTPSSSLDASFPLHSMSAPCSDAAFFAATPCRFYGFTLSCLFLPVYVSLSLALYYFRHASLLFFPLHFFFAAPCFLSSFSSDVYMLPLFLMRHFLSFADDAMLLPDDSYPCHSFDISLSFSLSLCFDVCFDISLYTCCLMPSSFKICYMM